jgi:pyruvate, orthophosphate dikinase
MDIPHALFEEKLEAMKKAKGVKNDTDLTATDLKELVSQYKDVYVEAKGEPFPSGVCVFHTSMHIPQSPSDLTH